MQLFGSFTEPFNSNSRSALYGSRERLGLGEDKEDVQDTHGLTWKNLTCIQPLLVCLLHGIKLKTVLPNEHSLRQLHSSMEHVNNNDGI